jgi:uncharacterized damage-inducible protein DinB
MSPPFPGIFAGSRSVMAWTRRKPISTCRVQTTRRRFWPLDASVKAAGEYAGTVSESAALGTWRVKSKGKAVRSMPRVVLLRTIMLNHWYHHRGQLSVYLRKLDVPVPSIYGPSADENPFA